jgi:hypothetical protein
MRGDGVPAAPPPETVPTHGVIKGIFIPEDAKRLWEVKIMSPSLEG